MVHSKFSNGMDASQMKHYLDALACKYNNRSFIQNDPISIPHRFTNPYDIEISGFLTATIAWGNRKMILRNADRIMEMLGHSPYEFIMNSDDGDMQKIKNFVHRTFNNTDLIYFLKALQHIYRNKGGLETVFSRHFSSGTIQNTIHEFHLDFFELPHEKRTERHVSDPFKGSAAKKINMFLRWMVRRDDSGVDFGIWRNIEPSKLHIPLDIHAGNTARKLGLLQRKQNDWKAVEELTILLREFDPNDPVKYDFALFGAGVNNEM